MWMSQKMVKLNADETGVLYITSRCFKNSFPSATGNIDRSRITAPTLTRNSGCTLDVCVQLKEHINSVCYASHFHLRNIGSICCYLILNMYAALALSRISSKLDYCNSLLIELTASSKSYVLFLKFAMTCLTPSY